MCQLAAANERSWCGVVSGLLGEQVADQRTVSAITVKAHRGKVLRKMKADSLADLKSKRRSPIRLCWEVCMTWTSW